MEDDSEMNISADLIEPALNAAMRQAVVDALYNRMDTMGMDGTPLDAEIIKKVADSLSMLPKFVAVDELKDIEEGELDVQKMMTELLALDEFEDLLDYTDMIRVQWFTRGRKSKGHVLHGNTKKLSGKDIDLTDMWWDIDLSLPSWILRTPVERLRLLHRQLSYLATRTTNDDDVQPVIRYPDVEDFNTTIGRFGIEGDEQISMVANAMANPHTKAKIKKWKASDDGQGLLFTAYEE